MISQEAFNSVSEDIYYGTNTDVWISDYFLIADASSSHGTSTYDADRKYCVAPVVHPDTGERNTKHKRLSNDRVVKEVWKETLGKECGSFAHSDG